MRQGIDQRGSLNLFQETFQYISSKRNCTFKEIIALQNCNNWVILLGFTRQTLTKYIYIYIYTKISANNARGLFVCCNVVFGNYTTGESNRVYKIKGSQFCQLILIFWFKFCILHLVSSDCEHYFSNAFTT